MSEDVTKKNVVVKNRQTNREIDELAEQYRVIGNRWWLELKEYIEANRSEENAVPLLLVGPTGTGKGLLARYVHHGLHGNWGDGDPKRPF
ncbi:MAG: hypothetical protein KKH67_11535, partial [candidate division Zixibacteria bacterium]|nr:hypothetical protein [candidate division Zixibacteria bacterium]